MALGALSLHAAIQSKTIEYKQADATLEGVAKRLWDDAVSGPRPGVLIVHQWLGLTDYEKHRAEQLAQLGYVAFCADIYGKGIRPKDTQRRLARWLANTNLTARCFAPASTPRSTC